MLRESPLDSSLRQPSKKGKERDTPHRDPQIRDLNDRAPQPTDLDAKLTALRRKQAGAIRPRDRSERDKMQVAQIPLPAPVPPPPHALQARSPRLTAATPSSSRMSPSTSRRHPSPQVIVSRPSADADHEDFSRRLKISSSPSPRPSHTPRAAHHQQHIPSKLFNPDTDPIPMRRTAEPDAMSDDSSSHVPRSQAPSRDDRGSGGAARQLFDHRKDDPVRFSVLARPQQLHGRPQPTPKSSADYVSASSTSSYAASISSSTFTLSSTTDGSSASSALFDGRSGQREESSNNVFSGQLKRLYREITNLETKVKQEDSMDEPEDAISSRILLKGKEVEVDELEKEKWKKQIADHKRLAEVIHNLLEISLAPSVPASLRNIPNKYNIIVRLWTYAFHKLLESLRRASFTSPLALEHLQDFIYYSYTFYTGLLEEPSLNSFKSGWLEALGDLARYRMAIAAMVSAGQGGQGRLTTEAVSEAAAAAGGDANADDEVKRPSSANSAKSVSDAPAARIDDSPSPSVGIAAARLLNVEPEKERWRYIAKEWYAIGLTEQPGTGKLHHHLGLLSREVEGEELRAMYHFVKSMTTLHPFTTSRESILPIWSHAAQTRRSLPDARVPDLFVLLHGMLFTNIQLDDFTPTLARFIERLEIEGAEEREWIMMGICNIAAVLEYGRPSGVLRKAGGVAARDAVSSAQAATAMRVMAKKVAAGVGEGEEKMDVDESGSPHHQNQFPAAPDMDADPSELPQGFKFALQLTFSMLSFVLRNPTRKSSQFARSTINSYLTVLLTFLTTVLKHAKTLEILERSIPWEELAQFFAKVPRKIMASQGLDIPSKLAADDRWILFTSGCAPPLGEDWCMRGMEWVGRKVYERGFWKSGEDKKMEIDVLDESEGGEMTDGRIEDDDGDEDRAGEASSSGAIRRRWIRVVRCGVTIAGVVDGFNWIEGTRKWTIEGALQKKVEHWKEQERLEREEEERRLAGRRWADDSMDIDDDEVVDSLSEEESEDDENDTEEVKALKARRRYLKSLLQSSQRPAAPAVPSQRRKAKRAVDTMPSLVTEPGYTVLVIDTNILLSSLSMVSSLIESMRWTVIIPLPVIMELDGLSSSSSSQLAEAAQSAMAYISSHVRSHTLSLKVQTSKGNYLTTLSVRTEEVDFADGNAERNMDDLILKAAIWQDEHWVDRSAMLKAAPSGNDRSKAVKVVLLSLDRNLRLKARSRQLPAASEKDLAAILSAGS